MIALLWVACTVVSPPVVDDSGVGGDLDRPGWCDTAVEVTWEDWGDGFMRTQCQGCHASQAEERYGAPPEVVFDTEADVIRWRARILVRTVDERTMPPAGGVDEVDLQLLETWLRCSY
ncbi:MAG: hypothetical protein D6798_07370 [Deltaproteobacteria bacterium]|nr:MAG: hypothetical protein D6798_07370 [Deltaproteobacteria bacterium]